MSFTLHRYIARQFIVWFLIVMVGLAFLIMMFDTVELVRRASSKPDATMAVVLQMSLLRVPQLSEQTVTFAMLFGSMLAFWRLSRHQELVVARAAGISVWQFLFPAIGVAFAIGVFQSLAFGPFAALGYAQAERMEGTYFDQKPDSMAFSDAGLWIRDISSADNAIVHASRIRPEDRTLFDVMILQMKGKDHFSTRIDAATASLHDGAWYLTDALISGKSEVPEHHDTMQLPTRLDWTKIEDRFASPRSMLIWELPHFIDVLEDAGFDAAAHRTYFHQALAAPFLLSAIVLIAASFTLRPSRRSSMLALVVCGIVAGILFYIVTEICVRLGLSGQVPAALAAWAPAAIGCLLGIATLLHLEDG